MAAAASCMRQLVHRGVMVPPSYEPQGFRIRISGKEVALTATQEEMAVAWVKKLGTDYVKDRRFVSNFFEDFRRELGIREKVPPEAFDFSEVQRFVEGERARKASLTREERKRLAEERRAMRAANQEEYGYALVDGVRVEIGSYLAEPSCIFMGRGRHPLRGRWKEGPRQGDITLNLSPDAPIPEGNWREVVWQPDSMWVARWDDKLRGKEKYVWLSDTSFVKQERDIEKFDLALELGRRIGDLRAHITAGLSALEEGRRRTATACYLIDVLKLRVGDEKDKDEADTVGATTLRPEHVEIGLDGVVRFDFLGKDSVRWRKEVALPPAVVENIKGFMAQARSSIFEGVDSQAVSSFLGEVLPGATAKVFRTYHASKAVEESLAGTRVSWEDPVYVKKHVAAMANLQAAVVCNHKRMPPRGWREVLAKKKMRLEQRKTSMGESVERYRQRMKGEEERYGERLAKHEERLEEQKRKLGEYLRQLDEREEQGRAAKGMKKTIAAKRRGIKAERERIRELRERHVERMERLRQQAEKRKQAGQAYVEMLKLQIEAQKATRDYNLGTSLKSYVDPRIYRAWSEGLGFDWKLYYPRSLQRKFSWVDSQTAQG